MKPEKKSIDSIISLVEGYQQAAVIMAATELGIIPFLESNVCSVKTISESLKIPPRGVNRLLNALADIGLVRSVQNGREVRFKPTRLAIRAFGKDGGLRHWTAHQGSLYHLWGDLSESIHTDKPLLRNTHDLNVTHYALGLMESYVPSSKKVHEIIDFGGRIRILDAGGGAGHYSILAALDNQEFRSIVFEKPEIATIARRTIRDYGLEKRITVVEGDLLRDRLPAGLDVVLFGNILHGKGDFDVEILLRKAFGSLKGSGRIVINEWVDDGSVEAHLFDITLHLCTIDGRVRTADELLQMMRKAGFVRPKWKKVGEYTQVIEAWKPKN